MKPKQDTPAQEPASSPLTPLAWLLIAVAAPAAIVWFSGADGTQPEASGATVSSSELPGTTQPERAVAEHRAKMQEWLESYGWIDSAGGIVRVPIEEGMQAVLRAGLPAREESEGQR